jgi:hypothetical protein
MGHARICACFLFGTQASISAFLLALLTRPLFLKNKNNY